MLNTKVLMRNNNKFVKTVKSSPDTELHLAELVSYLQIVYHPKLTSILAASDGLSCIVAVSKSVNLSISTNTFWSILKLTAPI